MFAVTFPSLMRYGIAILSVALALLLTLLLWPLMEPNRFLLLFAAVMFSSWYGGLKPGLLSALLATISDFFFLPPAYPSPDEFSNILRLGMFVFVSLLIGSLSVARKRAQLALQKAHDELEIRVEERTGELAQAVENLQSENTERRRAEDALKARARHQAVVAELGQRALASTDLDTLMDEAVSMVAGTLDVEYCKVLELLPEGNALLLRAGVGWKEGLVGSATVSIGLDSQAGFTLVSKEPVIVEDLRAETRFSGPPLLQDYGVTSGVSVIIHDRNRPFGVLGAHTKQRRTFTLDDAHFLQSIANVLATAVERRREEEKIILLNRDLERRVKELQALLDTIPIGIAIAEDRECKRLKANPVLAGMLGVPPGANASKSAPKDERPAYKVYRDGIELPAEQLPLQVAATTGVTVSDMEVDVVHDDGKTVKLSGYASPLFDQKGTVTGSVGAFLDITARKEAEEEHARFIREQIARTKAEAANRAKDEFLATASHELRTPLASMLIWVRMLASGTLDEETSAQALKTIGINVKSLSQLIDDLLDVSRVITGKLRINAHPMELIPVIEAAVDVVRPAAEAKKIEIETAFEPSVSPVLGDPDRLQQVLWNLLSNAIKFTPAEGRIKINLEYADSQARISISDTGVGIREEFLPRIFERFYQVKECEQRGLGLGLAIVRHLVELHGGTVSAESRGEGQGTTFTVKLPLMAVGLEEDYFEHLQLTGEGLAAPHRKKD